MCVGGGVGVDGARRCVHAVSALRVRAFYVFREL